MDGGTLPWMAQPETLNQLVEGSSPSRLTQHHRGPMTEGRAHGRGSSFVGGNLLSDRCARMSTADGRLTQGPSEELGRLLVRLRTERELSQKEVAHLAEINNSTLSRLESGDRGVSREVLDRISVALKLDRQEELALLTAAGILNQDDAQILADDEVVQIARLLHAPAVSPDDAMLLRQYVRLALAHAKALGYRVE